MTTAELVYRNLDEKKSSILKEFRETVSDILQPEHDDFYLLRWLVARNFDVKKSECMLRNHMVWRKRVGADTILEVYQPPEVLSKYFTGGVIGRDKDGAVLWVDPFGNIDLKGLVSSAMKREILKFQVYNIESIYRQFKQLSAKENRPIFSLVNIFDMENFGMRHLWGTGVDVFNEMLSVFEDHYPETLKRTFVVNAPALFPIAYRLVSPFLSEETRRKTKILGRNYKSELLKYIDADQLPVHYGGTKTDPDGDPKCSSQICYGGPVPHTYYLNHSSEQLTQCTEATVPRGSFLRLKYPVTSPGTVIRWHFRTIGSDIIFGVSRQADEHSDTVSEVLHNESVNSHLVAEEGSITCQHPGIYILEFNNKCSWLWSKHVHYTIDVLEAAMSDHIIDQFPQPSHPGALTTTNSESAPMTDNSSHI